MWSRKPLAASQRLREEGGRKGGEGGGRERGREGGREGGRERENP